MDLTMTQFPHLLSSGIYSLHDVMTGYGRDLRQDVKIAIGLLIWKPQYTQELVQEFVIYRGIMVTA